MTVAKRSTACFFYTYTTVESIESGGVLGKSAAGCLLRATSLCPEPAGVLCVSVPMCDQKCVNVCAIVIAIITSSVIFCLTLIHISAPPPPPDQPSMAN